MAKVPGPSNSSAEAREVERFKERARKRLENAHKAERRTCSQPPGTPTRDQAVEELRYAAMWASEWMV